MRKHHQYHCLSLLKQKNNQVGLDLTNLQKLSNLSYRTVKINNAVYMSQVIIFGGLLLRILWSNFFSAASRWSLQNLTSRCLLGFMVTLSPSKSLGTKKRGCAKAMPLLKWQPRKAPTVLLRHLPAPRYRAVL